MILPSQCSKDLNVIASSFDMTCHEFCSGVSVVFWLFCTVFSVQLTATDDEELFESQQYVNIQDIKTIVLMLKTLLYRLYCSSTGSSPSVTALNLTDMSNAIWNKLSHPQTIHQDNISQHFAVIRDIIDCDTIALNRCHQLWIYTKLFNSLFAVNLRRPFMSASDWQWSGVMAVTGDLETKIQQLVRNETNEDGTIDMTALLANDNLKTVLQVIPQVIPFAQRITIFQALIIIDSHKHNPTAGFFNMSTSTRIQIHRADILDDSFVQLSNLNETKLKGRIQVEFISETGLQEAGIDGGGLFKAFLDLLATQDELLTPHTGSALAKDQHLKYFNFIGMLLYVKFI